MTLGLVVISRSAHADKRVGIHQVALQVENRSLLESRSHLVDADHADVRAGIHRPRGQVLVERQMRAPCLVDDQRLAAPCDRRRRWPAMSAQVPYGLGLTMSAPAASGCWSHAPRNLFGRGRMGEVPVRSHAGSSIAAALRRRSGRRRSICGCHGRRAVRRLPPATAIIAAFTDSELPQVEKKACPRRRRRPSTLLRGREISLGSADRRVRRWPARRCGMGPCPKRQGRGRRHLHLAGAPAG